MALVRRSSDRYTSTENRSSTTHSQKTTKSSTKESVFYEEKRTLDSNNNAIKASSVESASHSKSSSTLTSSKKRSSIPIRQGAASPSKSSSPTRKEADPSKKVAEDRSLEAYDSEETPKLHRKVKKRGGRKVKRRNNNNHNSSGSSDSEDESLDESRGPRISVTNRADDSTATRPLQITYLAPNSTDDDSRKQRRNRTERPKTLPITFTVKQPTAKESQVEEEADSGEDTLTSGGEHSDREDKRTSIRIVASSARSSDNGGSAKKLLIEAKSYKRKGNKENDLLIAEREASSEQANKIYNEKTRKLINRQPWQKRQVGEIELRASRLEEAQSLPSSKFRTLPKNFKTIRVPIQTQSSAENEKGRDTSRRLSQPINLRKPRSDEHSDTGRSPSIGSVKSYDASPTGHRCKLGCTHVVNDTSVGPRIVRRPRENRRKSNPNQILGRTDIQGLRNGRPRSEIIRSTSLPRSTDRPRVKSTGFEEFVEINDLGEFSRSKSRTLPHKKKRVTYHEGTKDYQAFSESEAQNDEFHHHLLIHQQFTEGVSKNAEELQGDREANEETWVTSKSEEKQERAKEIRRKSRDTFEDLEVQSIGFRNSRRSQQQQEKKVEAVTFSETRSQDSEVKGQVKGQVKSQKKNKVRENKAVEDDRVKSGKGTRREKESDKRQNRDRIIESSEREKVAEQVIEEHINTRRLSQEKSELVKHEASVSRSQTLPRKASKQDYLDEKQREFEEFIRNQRNLLLNQLQQREETQVSEEVKGHSSSNQKIEEQSSKEQKVTDNSSKEVREEYLVPSKLDKERSGRRIEDLLTYPDASKNKRRHKSTNDVESIKEAKLLQQRSKSQRVESSEVQVQHSKSRAEKSESESSERFLLQNSKEAKHFEKKADNREDIIRVYSRGGVIQLSMEVVDRDRFEQRQREYEELQSRRSLRQQEQREINDERYKYLNNDFEKNSNGYYYNAQRFDPGSRHFETYNDSQMDDDVFEERRDTKSTQITNVKRDQVGGKLDTVHYTICTHYFYPENHELIVNLHRLGKIEVPRGLSHQDTCIFYNHLYVYEKEEVYAETLAPIMPKIKTEVVSLDEQLPEDETMSEHSSANQSYNDDASSQYSSSSRRERNLYSSLKAQKYYESKRNNNNGDSIDFGFDSTYETLRKKRKSYTDDEEWSGYRANSPGSSSGKSDFTYSKPRLLRRSDIFPGVGKDVEDDYPRWTPKSPTTPERDYGLSVAMPP